MPFKKKQKCDYAYLITGFVENAFRNLQCYKIQVFRILPNFHIVQAQRFYFSMNMVAIQARERELYEILGNGQILIFFFQSLQASQYVFTQFLTSNF